MTDRADSGIPPAPPARRPKRPRDVNMLAFQIMQEATGQATPAAPEPDTRNPAAVALSALGASKGGKARAKALSHAKRRAIARHGATVRWTKK